MDFNRHGVPGCSINDTYEHFIDTWRDVTLTDSSFTSILTLKGTVTLNGNDYYAVADLDPPAYFNPPCVEWPKAHMAFFVFEDVPRTICWYKA